MRVLIVLVVLAGLSASIGAIVVGSRSFDGVVAEKPYETGLRWDKTLKEKAELGWTARIENRNFSTGKNGLVVSLRAKDGSPLTQAATSVTVTRPSTTAHDKVYELKESQKGVYGAEVLLPLYGHWDVRISVSKDGHEVVFDEKLYAEKKS